MIKVLRINSGGGYGGPERSIESYTLHGRAVGFQDVGYFLLDFPGSHLHVVRIRDSGGAVTLFEQKRVENTIAKPGVQSPGRGRRESGWKARMRAFMPGWVRVQWASMGWFKLARRMMAQQFEAISCQPDVCHIHASYYFMSAGIYQACRDVFPGVPVVVHFHNGPVFAHPGIWEKRMVANADLCLFNSAYCEEAWRAQARPGSARIMPNPVEFPEGTVPVRSMNDQRIVVGTMGRLSSIKGIDVAIRALCLVMKKDDRVHLEIAGEGPEEQRLRDLVRSLGCEDRVHFLGFVEDVYQVLKRWHILLQPTKTIEAFGRTVVEAMASRCAVIASRVGGLPENVIDGKTGLLVPPGEEKSLAEAIFRMLSDSRTYESIVDSAFHHAKRYEAQTATKEMADCYREVVGRSR